jgi:nitrate/TMAO reductase-like tetraheme cytochrome c subunit
MTDPSRPDAPTRTARSEPAVRVAWLAATVLLALLGLGLDITYLTASPKVCSTCHEMESSVSTWKTSAHARIGCPSCHEEPVPWYRFPATLSIRAKMLNRDLEAHRQLLPAGLPTTVTALPISDVTCMQCHDLARAVTVPPGIIIDHPKHVERNRSCISCHFWTAHPAPNAEKPLLLMARCFNCHGRKPGAKASGACTVCHTKDFSARPKSHTPSEAWLARHGKIAKADRSQCAMCHEETFCRACHKLDMPHPSTWVKDTKAGHSVVGAQNRQICANCHKERPDLCSMCHHKAFSPTQSPWIQQHPTMVGQRGAAFCMKCHGPMFCFDCHTSSRAAAASTTAN